MDIGKKTVIHVGFACQEAEIDEQWSYVFKKSNQRWLWHAVDHATNLREDIKAVTTANKESKAHLEQPYLFCKRK